MQEKTGKLMKQVRFYNVIFPLWLLIMFPIPAVATLLCVLGNGLIDALVLYFGAKRQRVTMGKMTFVKTWLKVFVTGWTMDFLVALVLLLVSIVLPYELASAIQFDAFSHWGAFVIVTCAVVLTAYLIYVVNLKLSFRKLDISIEQKKKMALYMAVWTAPYLFYLPTIWFY